jgi:hydroxyacylglutathione hydrolase
MKIHTVVVGPVDCNCSIVACPGTGEAAIIDPGGDADVILAAVKAMDVQVKLILHTHGHFDHILATEEMAKAFPGPICLHQDDLELYRSLPEQGFIFGFRARRPPAPTRLLEGGETLSLGKLEIQVLHTPGHTPGSVCYYFGAEEALLLAGDTLFYEGVGRTDLPGGSEEAIVTSIRSKLFTLPGATRVIPGHGDETTIGYEREHNPFVT